MRSYDLHCMRILRLTKELDGTKSVSKVSILDEEQQRTYQAIMLLFMKTNQTFLLPLALGASGVKQENYFDESEIELITSIAITATGALQFNYNDDAEIGIETTISASGYMLVKRQSTVQYLEVSADVNLSSKVLSAEHKEKFTTALNTLKAFDSTFANEAVLKG